MNKQANLQKSARAISAQHINGCKQKGESLQCLSAMTQDHPQKAFIQELTYGALRWYENLHRWQLAHLKKPIRKQDSLIEALLIQGCYELWQARTPQHAIIDETVETAVILNKPWAKAMINALLRKFSSDLEKWQSSLTCKTSLAQSYPEKLFSRIKKDWPKHWPQILEASLTKPPMTLRVNRKLITRTDMQKQLLKSDISCELGQLSEDAIVLNIPISVDQLPGFGEGLISVQDEATQLAAHLLPLKQNDIFLDACSAPGGKLCHVLEKYDLSATALDIDPTRLARVADNLKRLQLTATLATADLSVDNQKASWVKPNHFDAILCDAPCSGTGVIRRHPDIKYSRRDSDFNTLATLQSNILLQLWPLLKPGGYMLYATCSILSIENDQVIKSFLLKHQDCAVAPLALDTISKFGVLTEYGWQCMPDKNGPDGLYFCLMQKI